MLNDFKLFGISLTSPHSLLTQSRLLDLEDVMENFQSRQIVRSIYEIILNLFECCWWERICCGWGFWWQTHWMLISNDYSQAEILNERGISIEMDEYDFCLGALLRLPLYDQQPLLCLQKHPLFSQDRFRQRKRAEFQKKRNQFSK